jgi:RNA polymerase sigma-70 factor (ECF subfamily)
MLVRMALHEAYRRGPAFRIGGPELTDLAHQAADDAMVALLRKLETFRGESRFTTWAYRFVALEVANKLGRHFWRDPPVSLDADDPPALSAPPDGDPLVDAQHRELAEAVTRAVSETLTDHQRRFFVAVVLHGVPMDTVVARSGLTRGAVYKAVFDARRKIRAHLTAHGHLDEPTTRPKASAGRRDEMLDAA